MSGNLGVSVKQVEGRQQVTVPSWSDRFWAKVAVGGPNDCWLWTAGYDGPGYGSLKIGKRRIRASRLSWELHHGPIPDGLFVCHSCDVRPCVNPNHLWLGTHKENMRDMAQKGRGRGREGSRLGEQAPGAVLTDEKVREIRALAAEGWSSGRVAAAFGINRSHAYKVIHRWMWQHVDDAPLGVSHK